MLGSPNAEAEALARVGAHASAAHDLGLDDDLRGVLELGVDVTAWRGHAWRLDLATAIETVVRENRGDETLVRISPQRAVYAASAAVAWGPWAVFALHRSHHDIDEGDAAFNRETISYEIYGVGWRGRVDGRADLHAAAGLWYDRGTTLDGRRQDLPFDHYLTGLMVEGALTLWGPLYASLDLELVAHRGPERLNVDGQVQLGWRLRTAGSELRVAPTLQRIEDYRHLGDPPRHLLLVKVAFRSAGTD